MSETCEEELGREEDESQIDYEWEFLSRAKSFLSSAEIVIQEVQNKPLYRVVILHLIAHGIEVLLKHELVFRGVNVGDLRKSPLGHNLKGLWDHRESTFLREIAERKAAETWQWAASSGKYKGDFSRDPRLVLDEMIEQLAVLHSHSSDYALRYATKPDTKGPLPLLLVETFLPTTEELLRTRQVIKKAD